MMQSTSITVLCLILISNAVVEGFSFPSTKLYKQTENSVSQLLIPKISSKSRITTKLQNTAIDTAESPVDFLREKVVFTLPYHALEIAVVFTLVSAIDGGFSGDWSRYGLISTDTEEFIKSSLTSVGFFHIFCGATAAFVTSSKGQPVVPAVMRTMLIGGLSLFKVLVQNEEKYISFPELSFKNFKQSLANLFAGEYDEMKVKKELNDYIEKNPCVMFSFTTCPYCIKAKDVLINELGVNVKVVELDVDKKVGYPLRAELGKMTGRTSVPSVWIGGKFIGGCNDGPVISSSGKGGVVALKETNELQKMLKKARAMK